jgi:hypothetical protein
MVKIPRRIKPAAETPSKSDRQRTAEARDERAAQIAVTAIKAATNGTRRNWGLLPPCVPMIPRVEGVIRRRDDGPADSGPAH